MLPRSHSDEQDEPNETGIFQFKRKELGKKRAQSLKVGHGLCKKFQKVLKAPVELDAYNSQHTSVEVEEDMFIYGISREPSKHGSGITSNKSPTKADHEHLMGEVELKSESTIKISCAVPTNSPASDHKVLVNTDFTDKKANMEKPQRPQKEEAKDGGRSKERHSSTIVEHILKELQGINKIQEEISDLRQYLNSVSGSVDEVSFCVDSVLMEIEGLYSASATSQPSPQRLMVHHRSNQNDVAATPRHGSPLLKSPEKNETPYCDVPRKARAYRPEISNNSEESSCRVRPSSYSNHDQVYGQNFASSSSLSGHRFKSMEHDDSYHSDLQKGDWEASSMHLSESAEGGWSGDTGWSEEDCCSCQNSVDDLEVHRQPDIWGRYNDGATSTPGHSSRSSSEHLSLLFGHQYSSVSSLSSAADWRHPRRHTGVDIECDCTLNCPYSRSSGYHTMDAYADDLCSGPSRSISCSTMVLTDDDVCQDLHSCENCLNVDVYTGDGTERDWHKRFYPSLSEEQLDPEDCEKMDNFPRRNVGIDVVKMNKAMLTFQSALHGAMKRLDGSDEKNSDVPEQHSNEHVEDDSTLEGSDLDQVILSSSETLDQSLSPHKRNDGRRFQEEYDLSDLLQMDKTNASQIFDPQESTSGTASPSCNQTEYYSKDHSFSADGPPSGKQLLHEAGSLEFITDVDTVERGHGETGHMEMALFACEGTETESLGMVLEAEAKFDPTEAPANSGNDDPDQVDPHHQKCLANIQRVLKEQRQRHRLSRISRESKQIFSEEEFNPGIICMQTCLSLKF